MERDFGEELALRDKMIFELKKEIKLKDDVIETQKKIIELYQEDIENLAYLMNQIVVV